MGHILNIIICDDDKIILDSLVNKVNNIILKNRYPAKIAYIAQNARDLFQFTINSKMNCLYFIDIDLGQSKMDGIQIARYIKNNDALAKIVFVTNCNNKKEEVLNQGTEAMGFIEKGLSIEWSLNECILLALNRFKLNENKECIKIKISHDITKTINKLNILYVETNKSKSHFIIYHMIDGHEINVRDSIENTYSILGKELFMYSSRGILINKKHVIDCSNREVIFSTGDKCVCSISNRKEVRKQCLN